MRLRYLASAAAVLVLAACGGTSGVSPNSTVGYVPSPAPGASLSPQTVNVTVTVPTSSAQRKHAYLSPNTQSLTLQLTAVNGAAIPSQSATTINTYAGAANCTASSRTLTCTGTVTGAVGNDVFSVTAYGQPNATGSVLSAGSFSATINPNQNSLPIDNTVLLTLSGIVSSITMTVSAAQIPIGTPTSAPVIVNAMDPSGAVIVGPYSSPISVSITNGTSDFSLVNGTNSPQQQTIALTSSTSTLALKYNGNPATTPGAVSLQAQAQGPSGQLTTNATVPVLPGTGGSPSPPPGPATIYVLNAGNNGGTGATVTEYSTTANGNSAPVRTLALSSSLYAVGFAVDGSGAIYVGYYDNASFAPDAGNEIDVYAPGKTTPSRRIMADPTSQTILDPGSIALDAKNNIVTIVDTQEDGQAGLPAVGIYPAAASGAIAPTHAWNFDYTIGPYINGYTNSGQGYVGALAVDASGNYYVAGALYNGLNVFGGVFTAAATAANGGAVPIARTIPAGATTTIPPPPDVISGLALDGSGFIYVSSTTVPGGVGAGGPVTGAIDLFAPGASGGTTETPPLRAITAPQLNSTLPQSAVEPRLPIAVYGNTIFVANQGQNNVTAFATGATGTSTPSATISGSSTGLTMPVAIAVSSGTQVSTARARLEKHPHP